MDPTTSTTAPATEHAQAPVSAHTLPHESPLTPKPHEDNSTTPSNTSQWRPPGPNDVRSPCPALNALANHNLIPHDGRNLTTSILTTAIKKAYNTDSLMTLLAIHGGTLAPHLLFRRKFNLDDLSREKMLKHDGLLGRPDFHTGQDVDKFSEATWGEVKAHFQGGEDTGWKSVAKARYDRIKGAKTRNPEEVEYGAVQYVLSYGEVAALMAVFADGETGATKVEFLDVWFSEERLPYAEGWRPHEKPVSVAQVMKNMAKLIRETGPDDTRPTLIRWLGIGSGGGGGKEKKK